LGGGGLDPNHASTKGQENDDEDEEEQSPIQNKDAFLGAIRAGIQEGIR